MSAASWRVPREGVTREYLYRPFRATALNPFLTGPLLFGILQYPEYSQRLYSFLSATPLSKRVLDQLIQHTGARTLKILFAWGLVRVINNYLSRKIVNNWVEDKYDWDKEVVLITGGSGGFGELMVRDFAGRGITAIALDLTPPKSEFPSNAHFYACDVTDSSALHATAEEIRKTHGAPTVLINNAGVGQVEPILTESEASIRRTLDVNLIAHFLTVKEFVPAMVERNHGHIVTMASMAGFVTNGYIIPYACSKAANVSFHEGLSSELAYSYKATKVRTSVVHPTWAKTAMIGSMLTDPTVREFLLEPGTVSDAVVAQVLKGEGKQIVLPKRYSILPIVRAMPEWVGHFIRKDLSQATEKRYKAKS